MEKVSNTKTLVFKHVTTYHIPHTTVDKREGVSHSKFKGRVRKEKNDTRENIHNKKQLKTGTKKKQERKESVLNSKHWK